MRRWWFLLLLAAAACTSAWERHESSLARDEADGLYSQAITEERWLIDHASEEAPEGERSPAAEAERRVHLARLAGKAGRLNLAVEELRHALTTDPHQAEAVQAALEQLPLPPAELELRKQEFAWNSAALAPKDAPHGHGKHSSTYCWSYRVREVRLRHQRTVRTAEGRQRQATYDARPWAFHARSRQWQVEGPWITDVGTEVEAVDGPGQPRYRALTAAQHEFLADEPIPPCHRTGWQGPYDSDGTIFVAPRLPETELPTNQGGPPE
jgi:hypothetical protein